jgi:hypothetical protein
MTGEAPTGAPKRDWQSLDVSGHYFLRRRVFSFDGVVHGVYNTHDAESRADQAFAGGWLATSANSWKPPPVRASDEAGHGNGAASEEGFR